MSCIYHQCMRADKKCMTKDFIYWQIVLEMRATPINQSSIFIKSLTVFCFNKCYVLILVLFAPILLCSCLQYAPKELRVKLSIENNARILCYV